MDQSYSPYIEELTWESARKYTAKSNPDLFKVMEAIDPSDKYTFLRVRYPFGEIIMQDDAVYLPMEHQSVPLFDPSVPDKLKDKLGYRSIPFGFITKNSVDIYLETDGLVFSVELSGPDKGIEIGIFEYFGLTACYSVSSGARSLFMIPKISEARHHKKLMREYQITCAPPKNIFKQWQVFKALYNSPSFNTQWESEIIYLTKPWDEGLKKYKKKSQAWAALEAYLYRKIYEHSEIGRRKTILEILWLKVVSILREEGFRPDIYAIDTFKHLVHLFLGDRAGYRPFIDDSGGPITEFQKIYVETYGLDQIPTMMGPALFSFEKNVPVYYSMQSPTMLSPNPYVRQVQTIIEEMRELMMIKSSLSHDFGNIKINNMKVHELVSLMKLDFFHGELFSYGKDIRPTSEIPLSDKDFLYSPLQSDRLKFAESGSFIRGCVKIARGEG
ncbi:MAG: hypothetical protein KKA99_05895 [Gammaproteobacteria bacterium]|nr:hypothetical protein [Gammaproteobacteria bacterium]MBU1558678.1 hypothetical protein [Gammaproteobacteria bacterium]MBU1926586.1 hypothetical protein [Gammaproteobacteria bacterium]MBU2546513.1 hypothetical protein [Gammaproteobacteria bacterium]